MIGCPVVISRAPQGQLRDAGPLALGPKHGAVASVADDDLGVALDKREAMGLGQGTDFAQIVASQHSAGEEAIGHQRTEWRLSGGASRVRSG